MFLTRPCKGVSPSWVLAALAVIVYGAAAAAPTIASNPIAESITVTTTEVVLTCTGAPNDTVYMWYKDEAVIANETTGTYNVTLTNESVSYTCKAGANATDAAAGEASDATKLIMYQEKTVVVAVEAPTLTSDPVKIVAGTSTVTLTCTLAGAAEWEWTKDSNKVTDAEGETHAVTLATDSGKYMCKAGPKGQAGAGKESNEITLAAVQSQSVYFNFSTEVQYMCKINQSNLFDDDSVIPEKDHSNPCYKWNRDKEFIKRYKDKTLIDQQDFWNITVTLEVNSTNMMPWYNKTLEVCAASMFATKLCEIDLEKCDDKTKSYTTDQCKCIGMTAVEDKADFKRYTVYVNQKANMDIHTNKQIQLLLQPKVKRDEPMRIFWVGFNAGYIPFIELACKARCDKFKKDAGDKCDYDAAEKKKCEEDKCPCVNHKQFYQGPYFAGGDDPKGKWAPDDASDATNVMFSMTSLASMLCFSTALFAESF